MSASGKVIGGVLSPPSYAGGRAGIFDGIGYNCNDRTLSNFRAAPARVAAGGGADVAFLGTSLSSIAGLAGPAYTVAGNWPHFFRSPDPLLSGLQVDGWIRCVVGPYIDSRWGFVGSFAGQTSWAYSTATNDVGTLTVPWAGTSYGVRYYDWPSGSLTCTPTGAGNNPTVINYTGTGTWKTQVITGLATATSSVAFKNTTGGQMGLAAAAIFPPNALLFHNLAQPGSFGYGAGASSWSDFATAGSPGLIYMPTAGIALGNGGTQPDAAFLELGANDLKAGGSGATNAQLDAALNTIMNRWPNTQFALVASAQLNDAQIPAATWEAYLKTLYDLADTNGLALLDQRNVLGNYAAASTGQRGEPAATVDGVGHLQPFANARLGRAMARTVF